MCGVLLTSYPKKKKKPNLYFPIEYCVLLMYFDFEDIGIYFKMTLSWYG